MENEKRLHRCCFTGHRPEKLSLSENEVKHLLEKAIDNVIADGYVTFITGMAKGTDIWAAEIVLEKKKRNDALRLICAIPHPDFEKRRGFFEERRYNRILKNADYVTIISDHYYRACYQKRNEWMVDRSSLVIAVWNGQPSETKNTIDYADRKDVKVVNVLDTTKTALFTVPFKFDLRTTVKSSFYSRNRNTSRRTQWYIGAQNSWLRLPRSSYNPSGTLQASNRTVQARSSARKFRTL